MKTEDLIRNLAADMQPVQPPEAALWPALPASLPIAVAGLWLILGFRADLSSTLLAPLSVMRFVLTIALALVALRLALQLSRPEGLARARFWPLAALAAIACGLLLGARVATPPEAVQMTLVGKTMMGCLTAIPLLSVLPVTAILVALRHGASVTPRLSGALAGLAGGGAGAAVYALHCIEDSPLFYITWYSLAIAGVTAVSALVAPRLLRW